MPAKSEATAKGERWWRQAWAQAALVATVACLWFWPTTAYDFVTWDDRELIYANAWVRDFAWREMFFSLAPQGYFPLTTLTWAIDYQLFGLNPAWFHGVNVVLHATNAGLVVLLLAGLKPPRPWLALVVGMLFALHPLHVESVAWVTERKGLMATLFVLLSLLSYARWEQQRGQPWGKLYYSASLLLAILAQLSKASAVALPLLLPLLSWQRGSPHGLRSRATWLPLLPFVLVAVALAAVELKAQVIGLVLSARPLSLDSASKQLAGALWFYLAKTLAPSHLAAYYATHRHLLSQASDLYAPPVLGILLVCALSSRRWRRITVGGLAWFAVTIAPVLKVLPFGSSSVVNDRYMYLPGLGLFTAAAAGCAALWELAPSSLPRRLVRSLGGFIAALALGTYAMLSSEQAAVWRNSETLWQNVVRRYPHDGIGFSNLGLYYLEQGQLTLAIDNFHNALKVGPLRAADLANLGVAQSQSGQQQSAVQTYHEFLRRFGEDADVYHNLGLAYASIGDKDHARTAWQRAAALNPRMLAPRLRLAEQALAAADFGQARQWLDEILRLHPDEPAALALRRRLPTAQMPD